MSYLRASLRVVITTWPKPVSRKGSVRVKVTRKDTTLFHKITTIVPLRNPYSSRINLWLTGSGQVVITLLFSDPLKAPVWEKRGGKTIFRIASCNYEKENERKIRWGHCMGEGAAAK